MSRQRKRPRGDRWSQKEGAMKWRDRELWKVSGWKRGEIEIGERMDELGLRESES